MARNPLLSMRSSQIIKRLKSEAFIDCIREYFQEMTNHITERGLQAESIHNMGKTGLG